MIKKVTFIALILTAVFFVTTRNSFAQARVTPGQMGNGLLNGGNNENPIERGRYLLGPALSAEVMRSMNFGQRHLLRLSQPYLDPNGSGCNVELRAWVATVESNNGTQITVKVGTPRAVLLCNTWTVEQVNQAEHGNQVSRLWLAELQTRPNQYANSQAWIKYYNDIIAYNKGYVAQAAP